MNYSAELLNNLESLFITTALYLIVRCLWTFEVYKHDWCGSRRLLPPIIISRIPYVAVMFLIYWKLASLATFGFPERYAVLYFALIPFLSEIIMQLILPGARAIPPKTLQTPASNRFNRFGLLHSVDQRIAEKKVEIVHKIMGVSNKGEILSRIIGAAPRLSSDDIKRLRSLSNKREITERDAFEVVNTVGLAIAKHLVLGTPLTKI